MHGEAHCIIISLLYYYYKATLLRNVLGKKGWAQVSSRGYFNGGSSERYNNVIKIFK